MRVTCIMWAGLVLSAHLTLAVWVWWLARDTRRVVRDVARHYHELQLHATGAGPLAAIAVSLADSAGSLRQVDARLGALVGGVPDAAEPASE